MDDQQSLVRRYGNMRVAGGYNVMGDMIFHNQHSQPDAREVEKERLLNDLYYDSMETRKSVIYAADARTCQWIWDTNFTQWLRNRDSDSKIFWIAGKPGSGKSTLMKYLCDCPRFEQLGWTVVYFFFDFRLKSQVGNTIDGLLRTLLTQIIQKTNSDPPNLPNMVNSSNYSPEMLSEAFRRVFNSTSQNLFIIVDGLDEYLGNMRLLMSRLMELCQYSHVKLCLASRPEATIGLMLHDSNLQMSDHNAEGIKQYVDLATAPYRESATTIDWEYVRGVLNERAEGVFLWVYLVLEEILDACCFETAEAIKLRLDNIPSDLNKLYQRLLEAIPEHQRQDAALIYTLVEAADFPLNVALLQAALAFLNDQFQSRSSRVFVDDEMIFQRRLISIIGGMLHFKRQEPSTDIDDEVMKELYGSQRYMGSRDKHKRYAELVEYGTGVTHVHLIHRTIKSFMSDCLWTLHWLPQSFNSSYPDHLWQRITSKAMAVSDTVMSGSFERIIERVFQCFTSLSRFKAILQEEIESSSIRLWGALLHFGIVNILTLCSERFSIQHETDVPDFLFVLVNSRFTSLHLAMHYSHNNEIDSDLSRMYLDGAISDLVFAALHGFYSYLRAKEYRIMNLRDRQRNDIVAALLLRGSPAFQECTIRILTFNEWKKDILYMILSYQRVVSTFHVAIWVMIRGTECPEFLQKLLGTRSKFPTREVQVPRLLHQQGMCIGGNLLSIWACKTGVQEQSSMFDNRQCLKTILSVSSNIDDKVSNFGSIVHFLIEDHWFGHILNFADPDNDRMVPWCNEHIQLLYDRTSAIDSFEKLYLVEEAGADFNTVSGRLSALELFNRGRARFLSHLHDFARRRQFYNAGNSHFEHFPAALEEFDFMLRHKERKGHLPRPMVTPYDLVHYWCRPRKTCKICEGEEVDIEDIDYDSENSGDHECLLSQEHSIPDICTHDLKAIHVGSDEADNEDEVDGIRVSPDILEDVKGNML